MLIDYRNLKSAGVYTFEVDNTQMPIIRTSALRLLVGWNPTGPINVPVFINNDKERRAFFGDIDPKFEAKGAFLNRSIKTALQAGPVFALNLFNIDSEDLVNYAALSLDSAKPNPKQTCDSRVSPSKDYRDANDGGFIGSAQLANIYDRVRFWNPSDANVLKYMQGKSISDPEVKKPLFGFVNTGQNDMSLLVFKPSGLVGYDVTVREWFGGEDSIPYNWLRPTDYISDYFVQVVAVKGLWSDFGSYAADPYWTNYFTKDGIKYNKITDFLAANSITQIGSWSGCIIPNFVDQTGASDYIIDKINNSSIITGLTATLNLEALNNLELDIEKAFALEGEYLTGKAHSVQRNPSMCEGEGTSQGAAAPYQIDLVGHNRTDAAFSKGAPNYSFLSYNKTDQSRSSFSYMPGAVYLKNFNTVIVPDPRIFGFSDSKLDVPEGTTDIKRKIDRLDYNGVIREFVNSAVDTNTKEEIKLSSDSLFSKDILDKSYEIKIDSPTNGEKTLNANSLTKTTTDIVAKIKDAVSKLTAEKIPVYSLSAKSLLFRENSKEYVKDLIEKINTASSEIAQVEGEPLLNTSIIRYFDNLSEYDLLYNITSRPDVPAKTNILDFNVSDQDKDVSLKNMPSAIYPGLTHIADVRALTLRQLAADRRINLSVDELVSQLKTKYLGEANVKNEGGKILLHADTLFKVITCVDPIYCGKYESVDKDAKPVPFGASVNPNIKDIVIKKINDTYFTDDFETKLAESIKTAKSDAAKNANTENITITISEVLKLDPISTSAVKFDDTLKSEISQTILSDEQLFGLNYLPKGTAFIHAPKKIGNGKYLDSSIIVQRPINSPEISSSLRFIPLRGLNITAKHMPGFDKNGCRNFEAGVEKIYEMIMDPGIYRGLTNPDMINYRYIIDTMAGGLKPSMGGKVYLSRLAKARGKCTALLNAPSIKSFMSSTNPYFCDVYNQGKDPVPPFDSKYVPLGGNNKMAATNSFSLMSEDDGATYTGVFTPYLKYSDGYRTVLVPPAADVSNTFIRKYNGGDPYAIVANTKGILNGLGIIGVEENLDKYDRDNFEPMGLNSIIQRNNQIMIYSNRTAYQRVRSDFNFLHVRELLNTIETEVEAVLQNFVFEYNNAITRGAIITLVNPILSTMRDAGAIYNYELEFNETPDDNAMIGDEVAVLSIGVVVNKGMEKIVQVISINKRGKIKLVR